MRSFPKFSLPVLDNNGHYANEMNVLKSTKISSCVINIVRSESVEDVETFELVAEDWEFDVPIKEKMTEDTLAYSFESDDEGLQSSTFDSSSFFHNNENEEDDTKNEMCSNVQTTDITTGYIKADNRYSFYSVYLAMEDRKNKEKVCDLPDSSGIFEEEQNDSQTQEESKIDDSFYKPNSSGTFDNVYNYSQTQEESKIDDSFDITDESSTPENEYNDILTEKDANLCTTSTQEVNGLIERADEVLSSAEPMTIQIENIHSIKTLSSSQYKKPSSSASANLYKERYNRFYNLANQKNEEGKKRRARIASRKPIQDKYLRTTSSCSDEMSITSFYTSKDKDDISFSSCQSSASAIIACDRLYNAGLEYKWRKQQRVNTANLIPRWK